jgi:uncharacterized membrane protein
MDISSVTSSASPVPGPSWAAAPPVKAAQPSQASQASQADPDATATPALPQAAATATTADASTQPPSALESITYGVLGIDPPDGQPAAQDADYHAGQWAGAALKIGGVIALLA